MTEVFVGSSFPGLETEAVVAAALDKLHNVLAELAALYLSPGLVPSGTDLTVVHDYQGVGAWMEDRWKAKDPTVTMVIGHCRRLIEARQLRVTYRQQRGHQSSWAGRDDYAHWNARADALATRGAALPG